MPSHLRLFRENDEPLDDLPVPSEPRVRIPLRDLLPLIAVAHKNHFIWLQDFLDDEVSISDDLHDVLMAFRATRPA